MQEAGKFIMLAGLALLVLGALIWKGFRGLPGDITIRSENGAFHFPIVTCLVISVILTLLGWLLRK